MTNFHLFQNLFSSQYFTAILTAIIVLGTFALLGIWFYRLEKFRRNVTIGTTVRFNRPQGIIALGTIIKIPGEDTVVIRGIADNKIRILSIYSIFPV
jgi:hypothetical protein